WSQSEGQPPFFADPEGNLFKLGTTEDITRLTTQTFFVEPIDTPVIFAAPRALALQGAFPYVSRDNDDGLLSRPHPTERVTYTVHSDTYEPAPEQLRAERFTLPANNTPNL